MGGLWASAVTPASAELLWGANGHPFTAYPGITYAQQLDYLQALGMTSYRVNVGDERVAPRLAELVAEAKKRSIDILPVITPGFDLANGTTNDLYNKSFKLAVSLISKFKTDIRVWELGNEMENYAIIKPCEMQDDGVQYNCAWGPAGGVGPLEYYGPRWAKVSAVLKGLSDGTMAVDPTIRKAMGTAGWGHIGAFERMRQDGIQWDISVWHAYGQDPEWALKKIVEYGKPIWVTELNHPFGSKNDGEQGQARGLKHAMERLKALETTYKVEAAHIYELMDETYWAPDYEAFMGLVTLEKNSSGKWTPGRPKLAYEAVRAVIGKARGADVAGPVPMQKRAAAGPPEARPPVPARACDLARHARRGTRPAQQVAYSYCLILGRTADGRGLANWTRRLVEGMSVTDLLGGMIESNEFATSRSVAGISDPAFVTYIYRLLLGSNPASDHSSLVMRLQNGSLSRLDIAKSILRSGEFQRGHPILFPTPGTLPTSLVRTCDLAQLGAASASAANQAAYAYCLVLGRPPDPSDVSTWTTKRNQGASAAAILLSLIASPELDGRYAIQRRTDGDYVTFLYRLLLNRAPDGEGLSNYTALLANKTLDRIGLARGIVLSGEFRNAHAILFRVDDSVASKSMIRRDCDLAAYGQQDGSHGNQAGFAYCLVQGRQPRADELRMWAKSRAEGKTVRELLFGLIGSPEFASRFAAAALKNSEFVAQSYKLLLGREVDGVGLSDYASRLDSGAIQRPDVARAIVSSDEFAARHALLLPVAGAAPPAIPSKTK